MFLQQICGSLWFFNEMDGSAVPALAEKWEISEDGKVYTFTLKDGILTFETEKMGVFLMVLNIMEPPTAQ